jgi:hydroxyacyl-ACP dehydratase HTD2-like protein with hotdog domain
MIDDKSSDATRKITPTMTTLFRYSALTYNAHKIHLDQEYTRQVEGFPDCLVHGPLTCTLLLHLAEKDLKEQGLDQRDLRFEYRALSPLFVNRPISLHLKRLLDKNNSLELLALDDESQRLAMKGILHVL